MELKLDCRYYLGDKPCRFNRLCEGCPHYEPSGRRILIIKLAALGDVLRTTPILPALRKLDTSAHITWVTDVSALQLLVRNPFIDRLLPLDAMTILLLDVERFDWLICLDKEPRATALATKVAAERKSGFGLHSSGNPFPLDAKSEYLFSLGLSDDIKFRQNTRSYQELVFEACGLSFENEPYVFSIPDDASRWADEAFGRWDIPPGTPCLGVNTGGGQLFANKSLPASGFVDVIEILHRSRRERPFTLLLLGGPLEREKNREILQGIGVPIVDTGADNSLFQFAALLARCSAVLTSDSLCMHLAIALQRRVVVLFGPTCEQEIELYGRGAKVVSSIACSPCYLSVCDKTITCMNTLSLKDIAATCMDELSRA